MQSMQRELSIGVRGFRGRESGRRLTPVHLKKSRTAGLGGVIAALSSQVSSPLDHPVPILQVLRTEGVRRTKMDIKGLRWAL